MHELSLRRLSSGFLISPFLSWLTSSYRIRFSFFIYLWQLGFLLCFRSISSLHNLALLRDIFSSYTNWRALANIYKWRWLQTDSGSLRQIFPKTFNLRNLRQIATWLRWRRAICAKRFFKGKRANFLLQVAAQTHFVRNFGSADLTDDITVTTSRQNVFSSTNHDSLPNKH